MYVCKKYFYIIFTSWELLMIYEPPLILLKRIFFIDYKHYKKSKTLLEIINFEICL